MGTLPSNRFFLTHDCFEKIGYGGWADFAKEISVIVERTVDGQTACYVPVENQHMDHILARTIAPVNTPTSGGGLS